jgi:hypothetical protein
MTDEELFESELWAEWVCVVCDREKMLLPTPDEWDALRARWHQDKAPIASVAELKALRIKEAK